MPSIGISILTVPNIAERNRQPELAPAGFGPGGVQHSCTQHAKFELADTAFHAKEQPIVWPTRIIDAIEIDDAGFNQPT